MTGVLAKILVDVTLTATLQFQMVIFAIVVWCFTSGDLGLLAQHPK
jgi:hypothetical protein